MLAAERGYNMPDILILRPTLLATLILLAVPTLLGVAVFSWTRARQMRQAYGSERLMLRKNRQHSKRDSIVFFIYRVVVVALLAISASGPTVSDVPNLVVTDSLDVVVVLDVSNSMAAETYRSNLCPVDMSGGSLRGPCGTSVDMAEHITETRIEPALNGNNIGLVLYAADAFPQSELTFDYAALNFLLKFWVGEDFYPDSNYAAGLAEAVAMFERDHSFGKEKVIILFSDGGFEGGDEELLAEVLQQMSEQEIRLVVVGLGPTSPTPIPRYEDGLQQAQNLQLDGVTPTVRLDSSNLRSLADRANGEYLEVTGGNVNLNLVSAMTASVVGNDRTDLYQYPLAIALFLLAGRFLVSHLHRRQ